MILGIDAANIRSGGSLVHLVELLRAADPAAHGIERVVVWGSAKTLGAIDDRSWLTKVAPPLLQGGALQRAWWQATSLTAAARAEGCGSLLILGGYYLGGFRPFVVVHHTPLPWDLREVRRYGWSSVGLRQYLLRILQARTFRRANGLIALTRTSLDQVRGILGPTPGAVAVIHHGCHERFAGEPRTQRPLREYAAERPYRILYVSTIDMYKHQWRAVEAVAALRAEGLPVVLELVGKAYAPALALVRAAITRHDPAGTTVRLHGDIPYAAVDALYREADLFLYPTTCETFGLPLVEAMSAGLPVVCAERSVMPELLGEAGAYFDPEAVGSMVAALRSVIADPVRRAEMARRGAARSREFTWGRCARETFAFLAAVAG